jgi:hypothetical protein
MGHRNDIGSQAESKGWGLRSRALHALQTRSCGFRSSSVHKEILRPETCSLMTVLTH